MRFIIGTIAFTLTFGLSASLVGLLFGFPQSKSTNHSYSNKYKSAHKHKIKRLLKRDVRNGDVRDDAYKKLYFGDTDALYRNKEYSAAVNSYINTSSGMNYASLPSDFRYAWRNHMKAWQKQADYLSYLQNSETLDNSDVSSSYSDNTKEINETWGQVLRIAERYGVRLDRSYYQ